MAGGYHGPLHQAAFKGDAEEIRRLVELTGADISQVDEKGCSPLHVAAQAGRRAAVRVLAELGSNLEARDAMGRTALHVTARGGDDTECTDTETLRELVALGADVNAKSSKDGRTPLAFAAGKGHVHAVKALVDELGADTHAVDHSGFSALRYASLRGHSHVVRYLAECSTMKTHRLHVPAAEDDTEHQPSSTRRSLSSSPSSSPIPDDGGGSPRSSGGRGKCGPARPSPYSRTVSRSRSR